MGRQGTRGGGVGGGGQNMHADTAASLVKGTNFLKPCFIQQVEEINRETSN